MYISQANILHDLRVDVGSLHNLLQCLIDQVIQACVFHSTLETLGKRRSYGICDDNIVRVLLCSGGPSVNAPVREGEKRYMAARPLLLGERWLRMEFSLSVAII